MRKGFSADQGIPSSADTAGVCGGCCSIAALVELRNRCPRATSAKSLSCSLVSLLSLTSTSAPSTICSHQCAHARFIAYLVWVPVPHAGNPLSIMWTILQPPLVCGSPWAKKSNPKSFTMLKRSCSINRLSCMTVTAFMGIHPTFISLV